MSSTPTLGPTRPRRQQVRRRLDGGCCCCCLGGLLDGWLQLATIMGLPRCQGASHRLAARPLFLAPPHPSRVTEAAARREVEAAAKAEPVDPGSQADQEAAVAEQLASRLGAPPGGCLPLLHLPQRLSPEGGATRDAAGAPAAGDAQEDAADAAAAAAPAAAAEMEEEEEQQEKEAAGAAADVRVPAKRQRSG